MRRPIRVEAAKMSAAVFIVLFRGVGGKTQLPTKPLREALTGHEGAAADSRLNLLDDVLVGAGDENRAEGHGDTVVGRSGCLTN